VFRLLAHTTSTKGCEVAGNVEFVVQRENVDLLAPHTLIGGVSLPAGAYVSFARTELAPRGGAAVGWSARATLRLQDAQHVVAEDISYISWGLTDSAGDDVPEKVKPVVLMTSGELGDGAQAEFFLDRGGDDQELFALGGGTLIVMPVDGINIP